MPINAQLVGTLFLSILTFPYFTCSLPNSVDQICFQSNLFTAFLHQWRNVIDESQVFCYDVD